LGYGRLNGPALRTYSLYEIGSGFRELPEHGSSIPTSFLALRKASSQDVRVHETTRRGVTSRSGLSEDELIERDTRDSVDLENGGVGEVRCGISKE